MTSRGLRRVGSALAACWLGATAVAAAEPVRQDHVAALRDFRFHTGETLPELRVRYWTLGSPSSPAVLVLHGTGGSGADMLGPRFGGALFGPGQPLDAATHYIIAPDAIGAGGSSKPSDGLRMRFPHYDYADMVEAQYRLLTSGGTRAQYAALPTWKATDEAVAAALAGSGGGDANDLIYQLEAAATYDPEPRLGAIKARVLAVNSEDDERNPVELGVLPRLIPRLRDGRFHMIPASAETRGHGTTGNARLWVDALARFLGEAPVR